MDNNFLIFGMVFRVSILPNKKLIQKNEMKEVEQGCTLEKFDSSSK